MSAVSESEVDRRPPMERLLSASVPSRLHLAMLLVGWLKLDPRTVLDLSWSQVDTDTRSMLTDQGVVHYGDPLDELQGRLEIGLGQGVVGELEVVIEAVFDRRAKRELHVGKELHHGSSHHVGAGVSHDRQRVLILGGQDRDLRRSVLGQASVESDNLTVEACGDGRLGQARPDACGEVERGGGGIEFASRAIGEGDLDHGENPLLAMGMR